MYPSLSFKIVTYIMDRKWNPTSSTCIHIFAHEDQKEKKKNVWVKPSQSRLFNYFKKLKSKWATSKSLLQKILPAGNQK